MQTYNKHKQHINYCSSQFKIEYMLYTGLYICRLLAWVGVVWFPNP
jgi:hypothetical protein